MQRFYNALCLCKIFIFLLEVYIKILAQLLFQNLEIIILDRRLELSSMVYFSLTLHDSAFASILILIVNWNKYVWIK